MKTENELIAEFMQVKRSGDFYILKRAPVSADQLKYNTSWDWLMPAIKKLLTEMNNGTGNMTYDLAAQMNSRRGGIERHIWEYLYGLIEIIDVYNEFVSCLKWYNSQNS